MLIYLDESFHGHREAGDIRSPRAVAVAAAGIVFGGGFPRAETAGHRRAAHRAIFYVQCELEAAADEENPTVILCDRGTVDGGAYWPGPEDLWSCVGTTLAEQ